jgi:murein DD-endopeptidase MepM/ murein hydrolase activator NlpD
MKRVLASALLVPFVLSVGPAAAVQPRWAWPTPAPHALIRQYLAPATPYGPGHRGVDIAAPSPVVTAPADGVVHFSGVVVDRPVLSIRHAGGLLSSYEPVASTLVAGDTVSRGDAVGTLELGHCGQVPCLHFGVRLDGDYVNPLLLLGGVPRSVLLPTRATTPAGPPG